MSWAANHLQLPLWNMADGDIWSEGYYLTGAKGGSPGSGNQVSVFELLGSFPEEYSRRVLEPSFGGNRDCSTLLVLLLELGN